MAKYMITKLSDDGLTIKNISPYDDYYTKYVLHFDINQKYSLNMVNFIRLFLSDAGNMYIYNISVNENDDSNLVNIIINYKYIENENGCHIFSDYVNNICLDKELYLNSKLSLYINKTNDLILSKKDEIEEKFNSLYYSVCENNNRIMSNVLSYVEDYIRNYPYEISEYNITKEELYEYINNNKKFIRNYILNDITYYQYILCISGSIALASGVSNLFSKNLGIYNFTSFSNDLIFAISIIMTLYSIFYYNMKVFDVYNLEKVDNLKKKMVRK